MSLADKVIWLTGASSGIGEALAYELSRYGAKLILSARRADELERVRASCIYPEQHMVLPFDLEQYECAEAKVAEVIARYGRIDILINNGGLSQRSLVKDTSIEVDERLMRINYLGTVALTKAVLPHYIEQQKGLFVVVSSLAGLIATPMRSGYCASKHALHGFFESVRAELHDDGVSVLMACPGGVKTKVSLNALEGDGSAHAVMDPLQEKGLSAHECAEQIITGILMHKQHLHISRYEKLAVYLYRWFPAIFRRLIRKAKVT